MKLLCVINYPDNLDKTNSIYQNMQQAADENSIDIIFQIQGLENQENKATDEEVENSDVIIIVSDKEYTDSRFENKIFLEVTGEQAENDSQSIIKLAQNVNTLGLDGIEKVISEDEMEVEDEKEEEEEKVEDKEEINEEENNEGGEIILEEKKGIYNHLSNGVLAIVPLIITGGLLTFISYFFGIDGKIENSFGGAICSMATSVFALVVPILAGFIAYSIADRAGFVTGLVGGAFASVIGTGFLGGIIAGLIAGYLCKGLIALFKMPQKMEGFKLNILVPLLSIFIVGMFMIYAANPFIEWLNNLVLNWIKVLGEGNIVLLCAIIGLFVGFDVGGVFSKATIAATIIMFGLGLGVPQAAVFACAMVPPLGLALAVAMARNKFSDSEKDAGNAAWFLGIAGLTEGVIPFAVADPIRVIPSTMIGSAITGTIVALFGATTTVANSGLFALTVSGALTGILGITVAVLVGVIVTALLVKYLK